MKKIYTIFFLVIILIKMGCEPYSKSYPALSNPKMYEANEYVSPATNRDQLKVVTWNIRWGCGRLPWFIALK